MAMSFALRLLKNPQVAEPVAETPKPSLFARAVAAAKNLKSMKREDLAWMAGNTAIGFGAAKLGVATAMAAGQLLGGAGAVTSVAGLAASALGLSAATAAIVSSAAGAATLVVAGTATAVAGSVLSAVARGALQHYREHRNIAHTDAHAEKRSFISSLYHSQKFRDQVRESVKIKKTTLWGAGLFGAFHGVSTFLVETETGKAISASLTDAFQTTVERGFASWNEFRNNLHTKLPLPDAGAATLPPPVVADIPVETPSDTPTAQPIEAATAKPEVQKILNQVQASSLEAAKSAIHENAGAAAIERGLAKAALAINQEELTNHYTQERLRQLVKDTTGMDAPDTATNADLAKQFHPSNPDAFLKGIEQQAPQLKSENVAASCETTIPKEKGSVNVIKTICHKFKSHMSGEHIVTLNNPDDPNPQTGLRLFYRSAVKAIGGIVQKQDTTDFLLENVTGPNGGVQEMTEQAFETAEKAKLAGASPSL